MPIPFYRVEGDPRNFAPDYSVTREPYGPPVAEVLTQFESLLPSSHILDIAGGYGRYALPLAERGHTVTILDCHEESLREAHRRFRDSGGTVGRIRTIKVDVIREAMPVVDVADAALCVGFLHHLDAAGVRDVFRTMTQRLGPGGLAVVEFSTDKHRRRPDGTPILVGGLSEQNCQHSIGLGLLRELYHAEHFEAVSFATVRIQVRQPDFFYDANMIIARGVQSVESDTRKFSRG